jgi:hypothetical protein
MYRAIKVSRNEVVYDNALQEEKEKTGSVGIRKNLFSFIITEHTAPHGCTKCFFTKVFEAKQRPIEPQMNTDKH